MGRKRRQALLYTDGSCDKNPGGNGGYAVIIFRDNKVMKLSGYEPKTTNQRMELTAVIEGLKYLDRPHTVTVCTDSAYVYNSFVQKWYNTWLLNGWKTSDGKDVSNIDLWKEFIGMAERHDLHMMKIKGHSDNIFNNECDRMAKDIIKFYITIKNNIH